MSLTQETGYYLLLEDGFRLLLEEDMAVTAYLCPLVGMGTRSDPLRPKYADDLGATNATFLRFGEQNVYLVVVSEISSTLHTTISGDSDCVTFPPLDNAVGAGALNAVRNKLEALNMPGNWVQSSTTYRAIARACGLFCLLCQRFKGLGNGALFTAGVTLDTEWNALPQGVKTGLQDMAAAWSLDTSGMNGTTTVRQILKALADQMTEQFNWFGEIV